MTWQYPPMRRLGALMAVMTLLAVACGDTTDDATSTSMTLPPGTSSPATTVPGTTTSSLPRPTATSEAVMGPGHGGEAVVIADMEPASLNPYSPAADTPPLGRLDQLFLVGISEIDSSLTRVPDVLVELPTVGNGGVTVNEDGTMTVRYHIREEARWADGVPISGDDFLFTLDTLTATAGLRLPYELSEGGGYGTVVPGSAAAGPKTFEFSLAAPTVVHEHMFSTLLPAHDVAGTDLLADWNDRAWVEGGPFRVGEWAPGDSITFVRNDEYWKTDPETGAALPYLDRVVVRFIPDNSGHLGAFQRREGDIFESPPWPNVIEAVRGLAGEGAAIEVRDGVIWEHFSFQFGENNANEGSLNRHLDFRRAFAHAIDRDALLDLEIWANSGEPLRSYLDVIAPAVSGDGWDRYPYDPDRARELLARLCEELGRDCGADPPRVVLTTTSNADERPAIMAAVAGMLGEVGIDAEVDPQDSVDFFGATLDAGTFDVSIWAWVGAPGLAGLAGIHDVFDPELPPPEGLNYYRWGTPAVTAADNPSFVQGPSLVRDEHTARFAELVDLMRVTVDEDELRALAREAGEILADQVVIIPLVARGSALAWWADELGGVDHNPTQTGFTWNAERWYRVDR